MDTKPSWRGAYKVPAPSFASAVGEDSVQPLVPGLSVGQEAAQLAPGFRHIQVVLYNKKSHVCACGAAPLYPGIQLGLTFSRLRSSAT